MRLIKLCIEEQRNAAVAGGKRTRSIRKGLMPNDLRQIVILTNTWVIIYICLSTVGKMHSLWPYQNLRSGGQKLFNGLAAFYLRTQIIVNLLLFGTETIFRNFLRTA